MTYFFFVDSASLATSRTTFWTCSVITCQIYGNMASLTFRDFCAGHTLPNLFNYQTMCNIVIMYKSSLDTFTFEGANNNDAD